MLGFDGPAAARDIAGKLAALKTGQGFVAANGAAPELVSFPPIKTFDTGRPGAHAQRPLAPVDVDMLRKALAPVTEGAVQKSAGRVKPSADEIAAAEVRGYARGLAEGLVRGAERAAATLSAAESRMLDALAIVQSELQVARAEPQGKAIRAAAPRQSEVTKKPTQIIPGNIPRDSTLSPTARRILDVLEAAHPVSLTFKAAALRAGSSPRSSQFRSYERELTASGDVEVLGDRLRARTGHPAPAGVSPVEVFASRMAPSQAQMLRVLARSEGAIDRDEVAALAGVSRTSSGLAAGLKELVALKLVTKTGRGLYALAPEMRQDGDDPALHGRRGQRPRLADALRRLPHVPPAQDHAAEPPAAWTGVQRRPTALDLQDVRHAAGQHLARAEGGQSAWIAQVPLASAAEALSLSAASRPLP